MEVAEVHREIVWLFGLRNKTSLLLIVRSYSATAVNMG